MLTRVEKELNIEVYHDHVIIEGVRVNCPSRLSVSEWLDIWESFKELEIKNIGT